MIPIVKFSTGYNSVKIVDKGKIFILCTSSDDALYLYKIS